MCPIVLGAPWRLVGRVLERTLRDVFGRDYFVSYARRDGGRYAARLSRLLGERHSVYLDQLDVPRGAKLPPRLRHALRRATVLVIVGSPEAARSASVRDELTLFLSTGRAVLLIDIERALNAAPWHEPPWASMFGLHREPESRRAFDAGDVSADVLAYLRDSFTYSRQERRLLRRAQIAVALIVTSVVAVAIALAVAGDARTSAEQAQRRVLEASRQAEEATSIANVARMQAETARADAAEARKQEATATKDAAQARWNEDVASANATLQGGIAASRRLAGEASARLELRPDLGFLLAAHSLDAYPTDEARRALFDAVARFPGLDAVIRRTHGNEINDLAVSADSTLVATRDIDGGTVLWDIETRQPIRVKDPYLKARVDWGVLAFDPSGRLLAVSNPAASPTGDVEIWDVQDRWKPRYIDTLPGFGRHVVFVSKSVLAVEYGPRKGVPADAFLFWDISDPASPKEVGRRPLIGSLYALEADPARNLIAFRNSGGVTVCEMPCTTATQLAKDPWGTEAPPGIAISRGRRSRLATMTQDGNVTVWDLERREQVTTFRPELAPPAIAETVDRGIAINQDGDQLAIAGSGGLVIVELSGNPPAKVAVTQRVIAYRPRLEAIGFVGGGQLVLAHTDGTVAFLDPARFVAPSRTYVRPESLQGPFGVYANGNGGQVVIVRQDEQLLLWTPGSDAPPTPLPAPFVPESSTLVAVSDDGQAIAALRSTTSRPDNATVIVWDGDGHPQLRRPVVLNSAGRSLAFIGAGGDRRLAVFLENGGIEIYELKTLSDAPPIFRTTFTPPVWRHVFDRTGRRLATTHRPGILGVERMVVVFDIGRRQHHVFRTDGFTLNAFALTSDNRSLVGFDDRGPGSIVRWDLSRPSAPPVRMALFADSQQNVPLRADPLRGQSSVEAMSRDGTWLALGTSGGVVVWDVERRIALGRVRLPLESHTVTFSDDGEHILAFDNRALTVVDVAPARLAAHACAIAISGLTDEEAALFQLERRAPSICEHAAAQTTRR
jgi:WD40 repeat protein